MASLRMPISRASAVKVSVGRRNKRGALFTVAITSTSIKLNNFGREVMRYENITRGIFIDRPNLFAAHVEIDGKVEAVHVKNTGRCRELLVPGAEVYLTEPGTLGRKTRYDLVAVRKENGILFNIDSQAPNKVGDQQGQVPVDIFKICFFLLMRIFRMSLGTCSRWPSSCNR